MPKVLNAPWQRFLSNTRHLCELALIFRAFLLALFDWQSHRLYLALDTTVLWNRALYDSSIGGLLWSRRTIS
ncbi:hypothetical protein [Moorena bouillonii]|uniref:hypothetical protein n=1 Tax=Moorena bouillonii TaxID=207920 RepID=UPI0018E9F033|nr:hypothetical protein [Moorena bouillonii]